MSEKKVNVLYDGAGEGVALRHFGEGRSSDVPSWIHEREGFEVSTD
ncbi:MAG: hypothetical protein ACE5ES_02800 [Candidatus Nanoarchaeia archaeon]